jgi:hypothetical protein
MQNVGCLHVVAEIVTTIQGKPSHQMIHKALW